MLNNTMTELEASRGQVPAAQECMVAEDVHGCLITRRSEIRREHLHTQPVPEEGAVVETTGGLPEAHDRGSQQSVASTLHMEALEEGAKTRGMRRLDKVQGSGYNRNKVPLRQERLGVSGGRVSILRAAAVGPT